MASQFMLCKSWLRAMVDIAGPPMLYHECLQNWQALEQFCRFCMFWINNQVPSQQIQAIAGERLQLVTTSYNQLQPVTTSWSETKSWELHLSSPCRYVPKCLFQNPSWLVLRGQHLMWDKALVVHELPIARGPNHTRRAPQGDNGWQPDVTAITIRC